MRSLRRTDAKICFAVLKVFSEKWFYTPGSDINQLPWDQCHKSSQSQLSQWQMPYWLIFGRFLKSAKISSSESWDHLVLQMENDNHWLMHRRINWLDDTWYRCKIVLCTQPDFCLGLSCTSPEFCSCSTEVGNIGHDPTFLLFLYLFLGLLAVPCNAGDTIRRGNAGLRGHVRHCISPFLYLVSGWERVTESLVRAFRVMKIVSSTEGCCWELPICKLISSVTEILYLYIIHP